MHVAGIGSPTASSPTTSRTLEKVILGVAKVTAAILTLAYACPAYAQGTWQQTEFVIGSWNDPFIGVDYYKQAKDAGFNLLTGTLHSTHANQWDDCCYYQGNKAAILSAAAEVGLKVLISDGHYVGPFFGTAPAFNPAVPPQVFPLYDAAGSDALTPEQNDALWGYFMWDEPIWSDSNASWLKNWAAAMHQNDIDRADGHGRAVYLNFQPGCSPPPNCLATEIERFVSDSDALRRVDVASATLYPFSGSTSNPTITTNYFRPLRALRTAMGTRPFWCVSYAGFDAASTESDPDENQLRFMAYAPVAAGAKGILWFLYRSEFEGSQQSVVCFGGVPSCKYRWLTPINSYLRDIVAPVAMNSTHLGVFHQSSAPSGEGNLEPMSLAPAVGDLGNPNFCVGVFSPNGSSDTYLLIVNKKLTAESGTVTLRQSYTVTQSPRAAAYAGGTSYTPVGTGAAFTVSLLGGEARMFRLTSASTPDIALTSPEGGEEWLAGQQRTVTWQGNGNPVDLKLYADTKDIETTDAPVISLATGLTGTSANVTMPAGTFTRRARLVVESPAPGGETRRVTNAFDFHTAPSPSIAGNYWSFGSGRCFSNSFLALGADGLPRLAYYSLADKWLYFTQFDGCTWSSATAVTFPLAMNVSVVVDGLQRSRISYYHGLTVEAGELRHSIRRPNGTWAHSTVSELDPLVGRIGGGLAMAPMAGGEAAIAYSTAAGPIGRLKLYKSTTDPTTLATTWQPFNPTLNLSYENPRSISMAVDPSGTAWIAFIANMTEDQTMVVVKRVTTTTHQTSTYLIGNYRHVALALNGAGHPRIVFSTEGDNGQGDLLFYRSYNGTSWSSSQQVDMTAKRIMDLKLAMEADAPRAAYSANGVVKLASLNGSTWSFDTVEHPNEQDGPVSLAYATGGERWFSYFDRVRDQVRVALHNPDTAVPATTTDLHIAEFSQGSNSVELKWTAPGDDGTNGRAKSYSVRMRSGSPISEANWESSVEVLPAPTPSQAGLIDSVTVSGLAPDVFWYFALKTTDNACNTSAISNYDCIQFGLPTKICEGGGFSATETDDRKDLAPTHVLRLGTIRPNPAPSGEFDISFTLSNDSPASLDVVDVAGRRVETHDLTRLGAGEHTLRIGTRVRLSPGLYWMRLRQGERQLTSRAFVLR
jgi:hypothetical protein